MGKVRLAVALCRGVAQGSVIDCDFLFQGLENPGQSLAEIDHLGLGLGTVVAPETIHNGHCLFGLVQQSEQTPVALSDAAEWR